MMVRKRYVFDCDDYEYWLMLKFRAVFFSPMLQQDWKYRHVFSRMARWMLSLELQVSCASSISDWGDSAAESFSMDKQNGMTESNSTNCSEKKRGLDPHELNHRSGVLLHTPINSPVDLRWLRELCMILACYLAVFKCSCSLMQLFQCRQFWGRYGWSERVL